MRHFCSYFFTSDQCCGAAGRMNMRRAARSRGVEQEAARRGGTMSPICQPCSQFTVLFIFVFRSVEWQTMGEGNKVQLASHQRVCIDSSPRSVRLVLFCGIEKGDTANLHTRAPTHGKHRGSGTTNHSEDAASAATTPPTTLPFRNHWPFRNEGPASQRNRNALGDHPAPTHGKPSWIGDH